MPQYSLKQPMYNQVAGFTPATFQGSTAEFSTPDYGILQRSFAAIDERANRAIQAQAAFNEVATKLKSVLNPADYKWADEYIANSSKAFQDDINAGRYSSAIKKATLAGSTLLKTEDAINRVEANRLYQEELNRNKERLKNHEISQNTFNWWLRNNPYQYKDVDESGNKIDYPTLNTTPLYADLQLPSLAKMAFDLITPKKRTIASSKTTNVQNAGSENRTIGSTTYNAGTSVGGSKNTESQVQKVSIEDIRENMHELIRQLPDGWNQIEQAYQIAMDSYKQLANAYAAAVGRNMKNGLPMDSGEAGELLKQLELRGEGLFKNGSRIGYDEWFARQVTNSLIAQNLAYEWNVTKNDTSEHYGYQDTTPNVPGYHYSPTYEPGATWDPSVGQFKCPNTVQSNDDSRGAQNGVGQAQSDINSRMKGNRSKN